MESSRRTFLKESVAGLAFPVHSSLNWSILAGDGMGQSEFLDVDGIRTRYFAKGVGQTLLLIHGGQFGSLSYSAEVWDLNFHALAEHFSVYAYDKPGQGLSANPAEDSQYTMEMVIQHAARFLEKLGLKEVCVVGHSRGALPAAHLAIHHPELVQKLVIVDSNTLASSSHSDFYQKLNAASPEIPTLQSIGMEPVANSYSDHHLNRSYLERFLEAALLPKTGEVVANMKRLRAQFLASVEQTKEQALESIQRGELNVPTLIVWGYNDPSAPLSVGLDLLKIFAETVPDTRFHIFNRCGHYTFREKADQFNRLLTDFVSG